MAKKRKAGELDDQQTEKSTEKKTVKKIKWTNKQRVLVFCARGITFRARHLMLDLRVLLPHSKADTKLDRKDKLFIVNEVCEMKNCNKCIFLEMRKKKDLFMWFSCAPHGPSAKFLVENLHTMDELKLTGNCLKGSRPVLSFDKHFDESPQLLLLKEMFTQIQTHHALHDVLLKSPKLFKQMFSTPNYHPKSKPFVDHILTFSIEDNRIWFRNFQIVEEDGSLLEIGPRFVLNLVRIFDGSFGGSTLFENPLYVSPNQYRRNMRLQASQRYRKKVEARQALEERRLAYSNIPRDEDDVEDVFHTITQSDIDTSRARTASRAKAKK